MYQVNYILIIIIIILLCQCGREGYMNNDIPKDKPDDKQFYACHDYSELSNRGVKSSTMGNNNYKVKKHGVAEPLQGVYSSFLDIYRIRKHHELFHAPICEGRYNFKDISSVDVPTHVLDHSDLLVEDDLLDIEAEFDRNSIKDPYYLYGNPRHIGSQITYSDEANELFIREHKSHDSENLSHRLDHKVYSN